MARKKKSEELKRTSMHIEGLHGGVLEQPICQTLEINYMPYAMSVIISRAIPEIDGFKPSHRKLLYTMYKMGLLTGGRTKSANIVGQTMRLNPHGDSAIYETMVRLSRGNGALLAPFVESKGNFGKVYSRDMAYAASRYTEAKLEPICAEIFRGIDADTVDFVDNYDATMKEPTLLPTSFPNILVSANTGIAVGMASNICGFNLREVCAATIAWLRDKDCDLLATMPAPDFPTGGEILYSADNMRQIYQTGRGSFRIRARWRYVKEGNLIEIYEIPYTTTTEAIMDKVADLMKAGKIREISDMRDETDLSGLRLTIDLKRGAEPEKLMQKLFKSTPLMDSYPCNFNVLIAGMPKVLGVREILEEWSAWRVMCVRRNIFFQLHKKQDKLHLLKGLEQILLDIDRAIAIIRETELDAEVIPNLMIGFGIDQIQAEFVAEIKLRNINREYILKRTTEVSALEKEIADLEKTLKSDTKIKNLIIKELEQVSEQYGQDRKTGLIFEHEIVEEPEEESVPDYPVQVFLSKEGYLKKITPQSLRMSGEQKFKEGDALKHCFSATNRSELLIFTNQQQAYKVRLNIFEDSKASLLGDYLPTKLGFAEGETVIDACLPGDYSGSMLFAFENGKIARVAMDAYATKSNRRKLTSAFSDKSPLRSVIHLTEETQIAVYSTQGKVLIISSAQLASKATRNTQGVQVMTLRKNAQLDSAVCLSDTGIQHPNLYRAQKIPAAGTTLKAEDAEEKQISLEL